MEEKNFQSIVRRVVLFPLTVLVIVMLITIISCLFSFLNMQQMMIDNNVNSLQISMNQLDNLLSQIDRTFIEYWNSNESYRYLKNYTKDTPKEEYLVYQADTITWLTNQTGDYTEVQGAFAYYENLNLILFRGSTNYKMHQYIRERVQQEDTFYNHWELVTVAEEQYLMNVKNYGCFYGGVWIPVETLESSLSLNNSGFMGTVYLMDYQQNNNLQDDVLKEILNREGRNVEKVKGTEDIFLNYSVGADFGDISMGILIPQKSIISNIPVWNKWIFILAFLAVFLVPVIVIWLQQKIARPVKDISTGMQRISEGDVEYRIPLPEKNYEDEFDRLIVRFNQMMDDLDELEFNLYKTKIKEQRTELKYISQQIRPHFILNALNIIYTYEESEFPLVKKMVMYLTEYFRYIVNLRVDFVEVEKELRHVENYLKIQKERYQERFDFFVEWEIAAKELLIPPLIIQTFVENCIKYGIKNEEKTFIYVLASVEKERLKLMIADTGNGFPQEKLEQIQSFLETREFQDDLGVGIQNAIERMDILYNENVEIKLRNAMSGGAVVEIYLPTTVE